MVKKQMWVTLQKYDTSFLLKSNVWRTNKVETRVKLKFKLLFSSVKTTALNMPVWVP